MDHKAESDEAIERGFTNFPIRSRWRKVVNGRAFVIEVFPDERFEECLQDAPNDVWEGHWQMGSHWNGSDYDPALQLFVNNHESRLRFRKDGSLFDGYEIPPNGMQQVKPEDRRHEMYYYNYFPVVALTRL